MTPVTHTGWKLALRTHWWRVLTVLAVLAIAVGAPYLMLSTTGPLIQSWASRSGAGSEVYRYFSLSNLSSLAALLSYPFLIEPNSTLARQASVWSMVYFAFAGFCLLAGVRFSLTADRHAPRPPDASVVMPVEVASAPPTLSQQMLWIALSGMGSWLLLAVTNHLTQNIAPVPLLWLLPLKGYFHLKAITLDRLKVDPAVSSAVFVTMATDVMGFFSFLGLAVLSGLAS